jgi:predicted ester cyclase
MEFREFVLAGVKDWNAGNKESFLTRYGPGSGFTGPGGSTLSGVAGAALFYDTYHSAFPDCELRPENMVTDGDQGFVEGTFSGTHRGELKLADGRVVAPTGNRVVLHYAERWVVRDDVVSSIRLYYDQVELLTQLGVRTVEPR